MSFTNLSAQSTVLTPPQQAHVSNVLEHDAEFMTNTQLAVLLVHEPKATQDEIIAINTEARHRALQFALLVPLAAGVLGLANSFRMRRLPDPQASGAGEGLVLG